jgi:hypothetical protein
MGRFDFKNGKDFEAVRIQAEITYGAVGSVWCPYFREKIAFNAKGIRHLKFKSDQQARPRQDQYTRLKLLSLAPQVLQHSGTVQGIWHTKQFEPQKTNSRWEQRFKGVSFYEFVAVLDRVRVRVIVKQVQGGEKYFWSIMPFWKVHADTKHRVLHNGDPEND